MSTTLNCGSHGVYNPVTGQCDCMDDYNNLNGTNKWTGIFCQKPPVNIPCVRSSDEFRAAHGGGDESCGNWGKYGVCNEYTGTCDCGVDDPFFGVRCQNECQNDDSCGGVLQMLPDGTSRDIGICDRRSMRCQCKNGWSGSQCRVEPANDKCYNDKECSWGGKVRGSCDETLQVCSCMTDDKGRPLFSGNRCSTRYVYEGAPCKEDGDCEDKSNKCVNGKCNSTDGSTGMNAGQMAAAMLNGIWSPAGMADMLVDYYAEEMVGYMWENTAGAMIKSLTKQTAEMAVDPALSAATSKVGAQMTGKIMANTASESATKSMMGGVFKRVSELANKIRKLPWGFILAFIQVWAMVLDVYDSRGLNQQVSQDMLDQLEKQFLAAFNGDERVVEAGFTLPTDFYPEFTVPYNLEYLARDNQIKLTNYAADYISKLTVNSNGQTIVPLFNPPATITLNESTSKHPTYWKMANNNVRVYNNLVDYGWSIWVLISLVIVSVVLICVFTSDSVTQKLKK